MELVQARKALNAMKGVVKLQAVIRGEIVRRKVIPKLRCMQSLVVSAPKICQIKVPMVDLNNNGSKRRQCPEKESQEFNVSGVNIHIIPISGI